MTLEAVCGNSLVDATPYMQSIKSQTLRKIVADEFRKNKDITDPATLHRLKSSCVYQHLWRLAVYLKFHAPLKVAEQNEVLVIIYCLKEQNKIQRLLQPLQRLMPSKTMNMVT